MDMEKKFAGMSYRFGFSNDMYRMPGIDRFGQLCELVGMTGDGMLELFDMDKPEVLQPLGRDRIVTVETFVEMAMQAVKEGYQVLPSQMRKLLRAERLRLDKPGEAPSFDWYRHGALRDGVLLELVAVPDRDSFYFDNLDEGHLEILSREEAKNALLEFCRHAAEFFEKDDEEQVRKYFAAPDKKTGGDGQVLLAA